MDGIPIVYEDKENEDMVSHSPHSLTLHTEAVLPSVEHGIDIASWYFLGLPYSFITKLGKMKPWHPKTNRDIYMVVSESL